LTKNVPPGKGIKALRSTVLFPLPMTIPAVLTVEKRVFSMIATAAVK